MQKGEADCLLADPEGVQVVMEVKTAKVGAYTDSESVTSGKHLSCCASAILYCQGLV